MIAVVFILLLSQASAQGNPEDRVTLSIKHGSLETVLKEIRRQTGYSYAMQDKWKTIARPVDISVKDMEVIDALNLCFKDQPFTYTIISRTIVVQARKSSEPVDPGKNSAGGAPDAISGVVIDEEGNPLPGATVEVKKSNLNIQADAKGTFIFKDLPKGMNEVQVSFVGYEISHTVIFVGDSLARMIVKMKRSSGSLDEVQIIAYGTTTKRLNVGNVSSVKSSEIAQQPVDNPLLALQGRVPGLEITQNNGLPGTSVTLQIRGINSVGQGSAPLFIIDGVPYPAQTLEGIASFIATGDVTAGSPFSFINPADIESIDVLKDAAATAIYGSQGANGVVLITTKKGKPGQTRFDIIPQSGWGKVTEKLKLLNTRQYLDMRYEAFRNDNATPNPSADYDLTLWDTTRYTDWQKVLFGGTAQYADLQGSLSGGNSNTQFLISGSYHRETLVFPGSGNDEKGSGHLQIGNSSPNKKFRSSFSAMYTLDNSRFPNLNAVQSAVLLAPDAPWLYKPDGSLNWAPNASGVSTWPLANQNPAAGLLSTVNNMSFNLVTNGTLNYEVIPGLIVLATLGYNNLQTNQFSAVPLASLDPSTWTMAQRESQFGSGNIQTWNIEPQLTYAGHFGKGSVSAVVGATIEQTKTNGSSFIATGFSSDQMMANIGAATNITAGTIINTVYRYNAGFGRLTYDWQDKYLLDVSGRRDGSSRFGPAKQFHDFYSIGVAWLFNREAFVQKLVPSLSYGKLRFSYGKTGNDQVSDYSYLDLYRTIPYVALPYQGVNGIAPTSLFNPDLAWEATAKTEVGLEFGFLKDRILFNISHYHNVSSNQLLAYSLPDITGFNQLEQNLNAIVKNTGWEFELHTTNIATTHFLWTTYFNLTANRNRLASGPPSLSPVLEREIGHSLLSHYVYHGLGVNPITGIYQFADSHGGATYQPDPATDAISLIDESKRYYGGIENSLSYRSFQLDFLFKFVRKPQAHIYLSNAIPGIFYNILGSNQPVGVLSRWTKPGDVSNIERFSQNSDLIPAYTNSIYSDLVYGDGSFIRLQNVALSWKFPKKWIPKNHLQNSSLFLHAQNVLLFTKFKGLDPEAAQGPTALPPLRVITAGAHLSF